MPSSTSDGKTTCEKHRNLARLYRTSLILDQGETSRTQHEESFMFCTYNARRVSLNADLLALSVAAIHSRFHVIAVRETNIRKGGVRHLRNGTFVICVYRVPYRNVRGVGFVVHPSVVLLVNSLETLAPRLAIVRLNPLVRSRSVSSSATHLRQLLMRPNAMFSTGSWRNEKSFYWFAIADFNAKFGMTLEEGYRVRKYVSGEWNDNGNRLAEFFSGVRLFYGNFIFMKNEDRQRAPNDASCGSPPRIY